MSRSRPEPDPDPYAEGRRAPARKDTRRWCLGKVGREHQVELVMPTNHPGWRGGCRAPVPWQRRTPFFRRHPWEWCCYHAWVCTECLKVVRPASIQECPDLPAHLGKA